VRTPDPAIVTGGFSETIGKTPHVVLPKLSSALGRRIVGKAEFLNPGGSVKDRAAKGIVDDAEATGRLPPGGTIVEGTAGNTGIALTLIANERGYRSIICIPDDQSLEKIDLLRTFGADVRVVPAVPFRRGQRQEPINRSVIHRYSHQQSHAKAAYEAHKTRALAAGPSGRRCDIDG